MSESLDDPALDEFDRKAEQLFVETRRERRQRLKTEAMIGALLIVANTGISLSERLGKTLQRLHSWRRRTELPAAEGDSAQPEQATDFEVSEPLKEAFGAQAVHESEEEIVVDL